MSKETDAALAELLAQFNAIKEEYHSYKVTCEKTLAASAALRQSMLEGYRQILNLTLNGRQEDIEALARKQIADLKARVASMDDPSRSMN
jgi:hypothetical protein